MFIRKYTIYKEVVLMMDKWTFGVTMLVVGMGGTIVTLMLFSLIMSALKKVFPYRKEDEE
jgi:sulfite exporter TauE/SafE